MVQFGPTKKTGIALRRETIRQQHWPDIDLWTGENEKGWFSAPRTLPLFLTLISSKDISGKQDACVVYLELLSRHVGQGIIEMAHEGEHAFAAGYQGERAIRTWQERMKILEANGFIHVLQVGHQRYKYVAIVHPTAVVESLKKKKKVSEQWLHAYEARKLETKEATYEARKAAKVPKKISVPGRTSRKLKASPPLGVPPPPPSLSAFKGLFPPGSSQTS